jgi:hypothetical protein
MDGAACQNDGDNTSCLDAAVIFDCEAWIFASPVFAFFSLESDQSSHR